ncbi:hypothetical protein PIB30_078442 [Stylosanthes scabra]|uniref:Uncharacterized protein n=1 Tax=Stylosanthes scabra TaxID=79078 RepID=A0ABU6WP51_9FABA|nr:hypothetical protein [Stylosanthes scabra]
MSHERRLLEVGLQMQSSSSFPPTIPNSRLSLLSSYIHPSPQPPQVTTAALDFDHCKSPPPLVVPSHPHLPHYPLFVAVLAAVEVTAPPPIHPQPSAVVV